MENERDGNLTDANGLLDMFDLSLLWRRKWTLLFCILAAMVLSAVYVHRQTPIYEVAARVLVQRDRFGTDKERLVRTDSSFLATQSEILRSPVVVRPALMSLQDASTNGSDVDAINDVIRTLRVSSVDDANVLKLTYRSASPEHAKRLLHAIVDKYRDYTIEMQRGGFADTLQVLAERGAELRAELEQLEARYLVLRKESPLLGQGNEAFRLHLPILEQLGRRLTEARSLRIDKETQRQAMLLARGLEEPADSTTQNGRQKILGEPVSDARTEGRLARFTFVTLEAGAMTTSKEIGHVAAVYTDPTKMQEELWRSEMRATELRQTFGPKHPEMRAIQDQTAMWRQRIEAYEIAAPTILTEQLTALQKNETHLEELYDAEFRKLKLLDTSMLKEQNALAEIERVKDIHDVTANQLRELKFAAEALADGQVSTLVRVLEAPDGNVNLVWPRSFQFIGLSSALGFIMGCVLIALAERVAKRR